MAAGWLWRRVQPKIRFVIQITEIPIIALQVSLSLTSCQIPQLGLLMKVLKTLLAMVVLSAGLVAQARSTAQTSSRHQIDVSKLGPQVGERVPDFALSDQNGKMWTLQSIIGSKGAMLVFIRSADW
jgi:hypothetical protein